MGEWAGVGDGVGLESVVRLAARTVHAPAAVLALASDDDEEGARVVAASGVDAAEAPALAPLCSLVVAGRAPLVVADLGHEQPARSSWRFRAFAGVPVVLDGTPVGALGVCDVRPRQPSGEELETLAAIARVAEGPLELRRLAARMSHERTVLDALGEAFVELDNDERCTYANRAAAQLLGFATPEELRGLDLHPLVHGQRPERDPSGGCSIQDALRERRRVRCDGELIRRRDGTPVIVDTLVSPILSGDRVTGGVMSLVDVTRRRTVEEAARRSAVYRERFMAILAHELRNPIQVVRLAGTLLRSREPAVSQRLETAVRRMDRMITEVLDFAQARAGVALPLQARRCDLGELCRRVIAELAEPGVALVLRAAGDVQGEWDADRLNQVIVNLVTNALKYGDREEPIVVGITGHHDSVALSVRNSGWPIPPEDLPYIFEPFRRAVWRQTRGLPQQTGLGLGLYIVRTLVESHGGTVEVSSSSQGTTFTVRLPRQVPASPVEPALAEISSLC